MRLYNAICSNVSRSAYIFSIFVKGEIWVDDIDQAAINSLQDSGTFNQYLQCDA